MEEIVTVDGRQYKLTTDRPLTAEQKAQTIAEIRKSAGCGTCGPKVANMGNDWQYGGVQSLASACSTPDYKASGATITVSSIPTLGTGPYTINFKKAPANSTTTDGSDLVPISAGAGGRLLPKIAPGNPPVAGTTSPNPSTNPTSPVAEGDGISYDYLLNDADIAGATQKAGDAYASIIFGVLVTDSCPVASGGPKTCLDFCSVRVTCIPPTCNFIVT